MDLLLKAFHTAYQSPPPSLTHSLPLTPLHSLGLIILQFIFEGPIYHVSQSHKLCVLVPTNCDPRNNLLASYRY